MKKIYAISKGAYSDYEVVAVFEDEATAQEWLVEFNKDFTGLWGDYRIEELIFVSSGEKLKVKTLYYKNICFDDNGKVLNEREWEDVIHNIDPRYSTVKCSVSIHKYKKNNCLNVIADTPHRAAKVANEKLMMFKAGAWGKQPCTEDLDEHS